jgi:G3E family GTPase
VPRLVVLTGFLGAGKTTTMLAAARMLTNRGQRVAVITNDQGTDLVDTAQAGATVDGVREVIGGCFCCRFDELADLVAVLIDGGSADTIVAEAVGSCTDLRATVIRPLRARYGDRLWIAPLATVVDPGRLDALDGDLGYLFDRQLAEADVIAVNKSDTVAPGELDAVLGRLAGAYPEADVLGYSAGTGDGLAALLTRWGDQPSPDRDIDVDYDRYAAAEAAMGWLNQVWQVEAPRPFPAGRWARTLLESVSAACARRGHVIGHAKLAVRTPGELLKLSVVTAGGTVRMELVPARSAGDAPSNDLFASRATAILNVRATCAPRELEELVLAAAFDADVAAGAAARPGPANAFAPAYPRPTHRLSAAGHQAGAAR